MDNCTIDCIEMMGNFSYQETCKFVQDQCQQDYVQFIQGYYCLLHSSFILFIIIAAVLFVFLYLTLNALTNHSLTPCVENVITRFKISPTLAGVTFLAFANGAPDVLTAILAGSSSSPSTQLIPFGSIFGGALFSTAFILSAVIFNSPQQRLKSKKQQILVPLAFYIFGISFLIIISLTYGKMNAYLASILLIAYIIFISYVLKNEKKRRREHKDTLNEEKSIQPGTKSENIITSEKESQSETQPTEDEKQEVRKDIEQIENSNLLFHLLTKVETFLESATQWIIPPRDHTQWQPVKSITSIVISPFVLALSQDIQAAFKSNLLGIPVIVYLSIPAILFFIHTLICWKKGWKPIESAFYTIYSFLLTIAWLTLVVGVLINLLELVQLLTNINPIFLGMTCLAWANTIGDYLSILAFAKRGRASTAISGIFSGQLFNFLIGFGASLVLQSLDGEFEFDIFSFKGSTFEVLSDSIALLVIGSGLIYLSFMFYKVITKKGEFNNKDAIIFRTFYFIVLFMALCLAILTDFFQQFVCDL